MPEAIVASTLSLETGDCAANSGTASSGSSSSSRKLRLTVGLLLELSSCSWLALGFLTGLPDMRRTGEMPRGKVNRRTIFGSGLHGLLGAVGSAMLPP